MVQFQKYIKQNRYNDLQNTTDGGGEVDIKLEESIQFTPNIPMSEIIEKTETIPEGYIDDEFMFYVKVKAHEIYNKYVKVGCEYEINIDGEERIRMTNILDDLDKLLFYTISFREMYLMFEIAKQEMMVLLNFSLNRWKVTEEYVVISSSPSISHSTTNTYAV